MAKSPSKAMSQALGGKSAAKKSSGGNCAAPVTRVSVSDGKTERSVEVRKIENGYIVRECSYGGKAGYKSTERFTDKPPVLDVKGPKGK